MITLKNLNVVKVVETEEEAAKLEHKGFRRMGSGKATGPKGSKGKDAIPPEPPKGEKGKAAIPPEPPKGEKGKAAAPAEPPQTGS